MQRRYRNTVDAGISTTASQRGPNCLFLVTVRFSRHYPTVIQSDVVGLFYCARPSGSRPDQSGLRSPCQVIRGAAAACPVEALRSPVTLWLPGLWEEIGGTLTYIQHAATGPAVFAQSAMKIPEKIRDARPAAT